MLLMENRDTRREHQLGPITGFKGLETGHVVCPLPSYSGLKKQQPVDMWNHVEKYLEKPPVMIVDTPPVSTLSDAYNYKFLN